MLHPGDRIGPYTLISKLGRGAFGAVWLCERRTTIATTTAALKVPLDDDVDLETIRQEATLWVRASGHPNVLPIIEANVYDEQVVIASEYAPDGSLEAWLKQHGGKAPSVEAAVEIMSGILAGLEHLHARNIIHRDLKPANILFQGSTPRLADFGISRVLKSTSHSTIVAGTPAYMSPEAFDGKRTEQTDIWSAGVIFYQLLAGRLPFQQADITSLVGAILSGDPAPLPPSVPSPYQHIIARALAKDPGRRYQSAAEMRDDVRNPGTITQWTRREPEQGTTLPAVAARTGSPEPRPPQPKGRRRVPRFAYLGAALLGAVILGAVAMAWLQSGEPSARQTTADTQPASTPTPVVPSESRPELTTSMPSSGFDIEKVPVGNPPPGSFPYFGLIEGYRQSGRTGRTDLEGNKDVAFDRFEFFDGTKIIPVEGRLMTVEAEGEGASAYQVQKTYEKLVTDLGGVKVFEGRRSEMKDRGLEFREERHRYPVDDDDQMGVYVLRLPDKEVWVETYVSTYNSRSDYYYLTVVEKKTLEVKAPLLPAEEMKKELDAEGRVALYINFDFNKADILPESEPIIEQIVKLLNDDPGLNIKVEGHTDDVGTPAYNQQLSEARAASVVAALTSRGIAARRLKSAGHGQDKPLTDNGTDEGRAKNRRVELVKLE